MHVLDLCMKYMHEKKIVLNASLYVIAKLTNNFN